MSSLVPMILLFSWIKVPVQMICTFMPSCWKVWQDATEIEKWQELQKLIRTPYMTLHWLVPWTIWVKMSWGTSYCFFTLKITYSSYLTKYQSLYLLCFFHGRAHRCGVLVCSRKAALMRKMNNLCRLQMEMTKMKGLWYVLPTGIFPFDETQKEKFSPILQAIIEHIGFWSKELTIHFGFLTKRKMKHNALRSWKLEAPSGGERHDQLNINATFFMIVIPDLHYVVPSAEKTAYLWRYCFKRFPRVQLLSFFIAGNSKNYLSVGDQKSTSRTKGNVLA